MTELLTAAQMRQIEQAAIDSATETAKKAAAGGYPASVLLMNGTAFDTAWTSIENEDT